MKTHVVMQRAAGRYAGVSVTAASSRRNVEAKQLGMRGPRATSTNGVDDLRRHAR